MTMAEFATAAFTLCNAVRVIAYLPQILRIVQDPDGARAVSCATWSLFAASHTTAVAYAFVEIHDVAMAVIFGVNTLACLVILALTLLKRRWAQREASRDGLRGREPVRPWRRPQRYL